MIELRRQKQKVRKQARGIRAKLCGPLASQGLISHFPKILNASIIAGFAPIDSEINVWPLLHHLHGEGRKIALPVVVAPNTPLIFQRWTPGSEMTTDQYGVSYPVQGEPLTPQLILVPLLAFTSQGERLGYGGGFYDRTLSQARATSEVFACGVAYAGQETPKLPTDEYDQRLDGMLTELDFRTFK